MTNHQSVHHPAMQAVRRMGLHTTRMEDFEHWTPAEQGYAALQLRLAKVELLHSLVLEVRAMHQSVGEVRRGVGALRKGQVAVRKSLGGGLRMVERRLVELGEILEAEGSEPDPFEVDFDEEDAEEVSPAGEGVLPDGVDEDEVLDVDEDGVPIEWPEVEQREGEEGTSTEVVQPAATPDDQQWSHPVPPDGGDASEAG